MSYTYYKFVPTPIIKREGRLYTPYLRYESLLYVSVCISLINNDLAYVWGRGYILDTQKEWLRLTICWYTIELSVCIRLYIIYHTSQFQDLCLNKSSKKRFIDFGFSYIFIRKIWGRVLIGAFLRTPTLKLWLISNTHLHT